jgi:hypothetical protein
MSDLTKVAETSRRGLEPVNPKLAGQYDQIVALLAQRLGPDHAFLFAEPVPLGGAAAGTADTAWYAKGTGSAQPLSALPEAEAAAARAKLERLVADIQALAEQLQNEGDTSRELGRLLRDALVLPDAQRVYVVDGRPVLVDWGNRTQAGTSVSASGHAGFLTGMGGAGPVARRVAGAPPPPPPTNGAGEHEPEPPPSSGPPPPPRAPLRLNWLAHAALWVAFVLLIGGTAVRLLDACALGSVWPAFVHNWLPGYCPPAADNSEVQAANEQARAVEAQIRQQEIAIAVKTTRCDALCGPAPTVPVNTTPPNVPPNPPANNNPPPIRLTPPTTETPPADSRTTTIGPADPRTTTIGPADPRTTTIGPGVIGPGPAPPPSARDVDTRVADLERGLIEVSLAWDGPADLDLSVSCPDRKQIQFRDRANCGGRLVKDMGVGGGAADAHSIEHIIWSAQPPAGTYTVNATLFRRYTENKSGVSYTVVLRYNGKDIKEKSGQLSTEGQSEVAFTFTAPVTN